MIIEVRGLSRCVTGGRGAGGEKTQACLPCDPGSEVACTTTALQQPVRIHRVLYFRRRNFTAYRMLLEITRYICFITHFYVLIAVVVASTRYIQQKYAPSYIIQRPCFKKKVIIFLLGGAVSLKQINNYPGFQTLLFRTEVRVNNLVSVDRDTKLKKCK